MKPFLFALLILFSIHCNAQWELLQSNSTEDLTEITFLDGDRGYICGSNGTFIRSIDGGENWFLKDLNIPIEGFELASLHFTSMNVGHIAGHENYDQKMFKPLRIHF